MVGGFSAYGDLVASYLYNVVDQVGTRVYRYTENERRLQFISLPSVGIIAFRAATARKPLG